MLSALVRNAAPAPLLPLRLAAVAALETLGLFEPLLDSAMAATAAMAAAVAERVGFDASATDAADAVSTMELSVAATRTNKKFPSRHRTLSQKWEPYVSGKKHSSRHV
jgi:hypothetical protein